MSVQQQFAIAQGEDANVVFTLYQTDGSTTIDVTGWSLLFTVAPMGGDTVIVKTTGSGITTASPLPCQATVAIAAADTSDLPPQYYDFELRRTGSGVADELTIGTIFVTP